MEGELLWKRDFGLINSAWHVVESAEWEFCSSPVIYQDKVIIQGEHDPADSIEYFILNETAARMLSDNIEDLLGSELTLHFNYPGFIWPVPITGIVKDFHLSGLDYKVSPMVIFPKYTWLFCFSIKPSGDTRPALDHLKVVWEEMFPAFPLEYHYSSDLDRTTL